MAESTRIARNTLMLYIRMVLSMFVGFYTSRVVLQTLGVVDYGIYNIVGGILSMMSFLNASMSSATSRFITYDLGQGDTVRLRETFNAAFQAHLLIALFILLFAETIGLWILNHHLVIPFERQTAAHWVYQFSVISVVIGITQAPYTATVMAHEQMDVYAWLELLNVTLKLVIVWLLQLLSTDHLITYGLLTLGVTLLSITLYRLYCIRHFAESRLAWQFRPVALRRMLCFTSWNLYADASVSLRQQGINILINRFFGVVLNASCAIASMIQGAFWLCGHNVLAAFRPQIIKQYARRNYEEMEQMVCRALCWTLLMSLTISVPALFCLPHLMQWWLGQVPPYAVLLCQILLVDNLFGLLNHICTICIYAEGNIRSFSLWNGTLKLVCLPIIYLLLLHCAHPAIPYLFSLGMLFIIFAMNFLLLKKQIPQIHLSKLIKSTSRPALVAFFSLVPFLLLHHLLSQGWAHTLIFTLGYLLLLSIGTFYYILDQDSRHLVKQKLVCILK